MDPSASTPSKDVRRQHWEERYRRDLGDSSWYHEDAPPQLIDLVHSDRLPEGVALDLGCGTGVATAVIAERGRPTVGLDIALSALVQARARLAAGSGQASFVVGDATKLPFPNASFVFLFDRGCLQNVDRSAWPAYFQEVDRVLAEGGTLQLFASRVAPASGRRFKAALRRLAGRPGRGGGGGGGLPALVSTLLPPSMRIVASDQSRFTTPAGKARIMFHALIEKPLAGTASTAAP
jgi:SAM-dependent methyltransferase